MSEGLKDDPEWQLKLNSFIDDAEPAIKGIIRSEPNVSIDDKLDIAQDVRVELVKRISRPENGVIRSVSAYAATAFYNALQKLRHARQREIARLQPTHITTAGDDDPLANIPDTRPTQEAKMIEGECERVLQNAIQELWKTICQLRELHRAALLLQMELELFRSAGVASMRDIARALGIPEDNFAGLWYQLPLDDRTIAEKIFPQYYGVTVERQKVINFRKCAREFLFRRLERNYPEITKLLSNIRH
jgi:RNA polymerase sigma factor (sigma-70 family)